MAYSLSQLNQMDRAEFTTALGAIFEDTPIIAERAWLDRPFESLAALHQSMVKVVRHLSVAEQMALICAHPDLGSRAKMADASVQEQAAAGLDQLTPAEFEQFQRLNQAYKERFSFPFIIAVKGQTKSSILAAFEQRLQNSPQDEQAQALSEIFQIAQFRLRDQIQA